MPNDESKPSYSGSFVLGSAGGDLLTIRPGGTVEAPSLEAASEAGRVFVESVRGYLSPENERARIVAYLRDLGLSIELRGVSGAIHIGLADAIERGKHWMPLPEAPEGV